MPKTLFIGIDGGTWNILEPLIRDGKLKRFKEMVENGAYGTLRSTIPYTTLAGWTSTFTGVNPGKHGLIDNMIYEGGEFRLANSSYRMVPTIWNLMSNKGVKITLVNDPVTYPPEPIGIHITGLLTPFTSNNYTHPPTLKKEIDKIANGYIPDIQRDYYETLSKDLEQAFKMVEDYSNKINRVGKYLLKNYEWNLGCVIFTSTDRLQHFFWHKKQYIYNHYRTIDSYLKEYLDMASEEEANIIITSDHGFTEVHTFFYINAWLYRKGLVLPRREAKITHELRRWGITRSSVIKTLRKSRLLYKIMKTLTPKRVKRLLPLAERLQIDYEKSKIYAVTNLGLFINKEDSENINLKELLREIKSLKDEEGQPLIEDVITREELYTGKYSYRAPHIIILPKKGYKVRSELFTDFRLYSQPYYADYNIKPTGEHAIEGILIVYGPDIAHREVNQKIVWDIAPTILHIHGQPIPDYFDGQVIKEIFKESSEIKTRKIKIMKTSAKTIMKKRISWIKSHKLSGGIN